VQALVAAVAVGTVSLNVQGQTLAHANRSFRGAASTSGRPRARTEELHGSGGEDGGGSDG
jgi:hypothetical protein